jgi:hypothetical protein
MHELNHGQNNCNQELKFDNKRTERSTRERSRRAIAFSRRLLPTKHQGQTLSLTMSTFTKRFAMLDIAGILEQWEELTAGPRGTKSGSG